MMGRLQMYGGYAITVLSIVARIVLLAMVVASLRENVSMTFPFVRPEAALSLAYLAGVVWLCK